MNSIKHIKELYQNYELTKDQAYHDDLGKYVLGNVSVNTIFELATASVRLNSTNFFSDDFIHALEEEQTSRSSHNIYRLENDMKIIEEYEVASYDNPGEIEIQSSENLLETGSVFKVRKNQINQDSPLLYANEEHVSYFDFKQQKTIQEMVDQQEITQISYEDLHPKESDQKIPFDQTLKLQVNI